MKKLSFLALLLVSLTSTAQNYDFEELYGPYSFAEFKKTYYKKLNQIQQENLDKYLTADMSSKFGDLDSSRIQVYFKDLDAIIEINRFALWRNYLNVHEIYNKMDKLSIQNSGTHRGIMKEIIDAKDMIITLKNSSYNLIKIIPTDSALGQRVIKYLLENEERY